MGADSGEPGVMTQLVVNDVPDDLVRRLETRARRNKRSAEAEHRAILHDALAPDSGSLRSIASVWRRRLQFPNDDDVQFVLRNATRHHKRR